ncbi:MAG TPA: NADH-quinone oxidoreductase subunit C [Rhizomicrobium sp.]|jgi:NADH-quinone oxidoreductase subunit C|nr:NADH-quinone oxidoreductase subunit C [Rhizomicrobium sp.]
MQTLQDLGSKLAEALPGAVRGWNIAFGELTIEAETAEIIRVLSHLRDDPDCRFTLLIDITAVDWPQREKRFDVVYLLLSLSGNRRIRVKLQVEETVPVPSAVELFPAADWAERETFDMYGITFAQHPDLRRILTDYGFSGYPLRKDFPLTGYVELRYDEEQKRVVYQPVELVQEFRDFDFMSPWEGARYILPDDKAKKENP